MRSSLAFSLLLIAGSLIPAAARADSGVAVITADQKLNCVFLKFITTHGSDALAQARSKAAGYGADSVYVMNDSSASGGGLSVEAVKCGH